MAAIDFPASPNNGDTISVATNTGEVIYVYDGTKGYWYVSTSGVQGPQGDAATVQVGTVTTGDPGTSVSVVNSGTSGAAVLDFTIPRGDTGAAGGAGLAIAMAMVFG
jgi:hypothetical protein